MARFRPAIGSLLLVTILSAGALRCGSSVTTLSPTPSKCPTTLGASADAIGADGGTSSVTVTTPPECAWTATADADWISELSPASGQGSAVIRFTAAGNPGGALREGGIVVNDQRVAVRQQAACPIAITPATVSFSGSGGEEEVDVSAPESCTWSVQESVSWIVVSPASATGSASITMTAATNVGGSREATLTIGGRTVMARQESVPSTPQPLPPVGPVPTPEPTPSPTPAPPPDSGGSPPPAQTCAFGLSPTAASAGSAAGSTSVTVTTAATCEWSVASGASWISVGGAATRTGPGSVSLSYAANPGAARAGTVTVAGLAFTLSQASGCSYTVSQTALEVSKGGDENLTLVVTTAAGCAWTATSSNDWITITAGAAGTGPGNVVFDVAKNQGPSRTGQLTIAGIVVTIKQ